MLRTIKDKNVRNLIKLPKVLAPKDVAPFSDAGLTGLQSC